MAALQDHARTHAHEHSWGGGTWASLPVQGQTLTDTPDLYGLHTHVVIWVPSSQEKYILDGQLDKWALVTSWALCLYEFDYSEYLNGIIVYLALL